MKSFFKFLFLIIISLGLSKPLFSQDILKGKNAFGKAESNIKFSSLWQHENLKPGDSSNLAVVVDFGKGFHFNPPAHLIPANYPVDVVATKVKVSQISNKAIAQSPIYLNPFSEFSKEFNTDLKFYKNQTYIYIPIKLDSKFTENKLQVSVEIYYQLCNETNCFIPKTETITAEIDVSLNAESKLINETVFSQIPKESLEVLSKGEQSFGYSDWKFNFNADSTTGFFIMLFMAFIGGALLNFTPCVLPIIPIKIMGLSHSAGSRKKGIYLGLVMSAGIISFWLLMGILISSVSKFSSISKLYQYPEFTITVGIIIGAMAVGMCGLFNIQVPQKIAVLNPRFNSTLGSFGIGVMTAILSTPCTAPFMGSASAWAIQQSQQTTLLIFFSIGFGMALPYFILSSFPVLVKWVPKSGPVSVVIKEVMGILMLAAASYFIGVGITNSVESFKGSSNYWWITMTIVAFAGMWIIIRTSQIKPSAMKRFFFSALGSIIITMSLITLKSMTATGPLKWQDYSAEIFAKAKEENKIILLDFTAEWCLNCKVLEKSVLNSKEVSEAITNANTTLIKVDMSNGDEVKSKLINAEGSLTIPFLVIYKNGKKVFQADFYTKADIIKAVTK